MKKLIDLWGKMPPNLQNILLSTVVCIGMTASGASVEACQAIHNIFAAQGAA